MPTLLKTNGKAREMQKEYKSYKIKNGPCHLYPIHWLWVEQTQQSLHAVPTGRERRRTDRGLSEHRGKSQMSGRGNKDEYIRREIVASWVAFRRLRNFLDITGRPLGCKTKQNKSFHKGSGRPRKYFKRSLDGVQAAWRTGVLSKIWERTLPRSCDIIWLTIGILTRGLHFTIHILEDNLDHPGSECTCSICLVGVVGEDPGRRQF